MDLRHLRTFVTVTERGTVSNAALDLGVAQPALSKQISDLERELGIRLFDRVGRRLLLTSEGEQLLASCRGILGQVVSLGEQAQLLRRGDIGVLKVAASPVQIETVLATFLSQYRKRFPHVELKLFESVGADTLAMLERGEIHLAISLVEAIQADDRNLGFYPVPPLEVMAACHPSFGFKHGSTADIGRVVLHPLLLQDSGFVLRKTFNAVCRVAKLKQNILIESRAPHTLLALAEAELGIAIVPSAVRTDRYALCCFHVTYKGNPIRDPLAVVWDKRRALPPYGREFCDLLASHMRQLLPLTHPRGSAVLGAGKRKTPGRKRPRHV